MGRAFYTHDQITPLPADFHLLPFNFTRFHSKELIVNEAGEFLFVPSGTVRQLVEGHLDIGSELYQDLKAKHFIYDDSSSALLDVLATKIRTKYEHLIGGTKLHIFVVTLRCDHSCKYCQVSRQVESRGAFDMERTTVDRALLMMMDSPAHDLTLEIQGGEPLLAFETIQYAIPKAKMLAHDRGKALTIVVCTNLSHATDDILAYFRDEGVKVSTSLDGPEFLHNKNRPRHGNDSYGKTIEGIERSRTYLGSENVAALMTTTALSLDYPTEIVDEYMRCGFHSIFLRPVSPYGFAVRTRRQTGYEMDRFLDFYRRGLTHILEINRKGYYLDEVFTKILLTKILTPYGTSYVDMQSPAGAAWNVLVYNYDGDVYASDESRMLAEMHDWTFRLGNVHKDTRRTIFMSDAALQMFQGSCNQALLGCSDCAFQSYCGADPIYHHATQGDMYGNRPTSGFCARNMGVFRYLFSLIEEDDPDVMNVLWSWIVRKAQLSEDPLCA